MTKKSPLNDIHKQLGARFTEFSGFEMPLQYSSIKEEHMAVRKNVGLFDVSHMSNVWISGPDAEKLITLTTIEDASRIPDKKSQYTTFLRDDATIIDDTIFMHLDDKFMIIPNAGMDEIVAKWLEEKAKENKLQATIKNVSDEYVILAVQGPKSRDTLQKLTDTDLDEVKFFGCQYIDIAGINCIISHTGYTGELGFELHITPPEKAKDLFLKIMKAGEQFSIKPIGLGARDTLRLEKCFLLAGNEFHGGRTPLEAVLGWAIHWDHEFIGKHSLLKQKQTATYHRLTSFICNDKGVPRHGSVVESEGKQVGVITSGSLSPCLNTGIAMGYVHPEYREQGTQLDIMIRGKPLKARVVKPPIVPKDWNSKN